VVALVGAGLGFWAARAFIGLGWLSDPINLFYLTTLGLLSGYLIGGLLARALASWWNRLTKSVRTVSPDAVLAGVIGATVALVITVLLNSVLERVPGFTWYVSLLITLVLVTTSSWFFIKHRHYFSPRLAQANAGAPPAPARAGAVAKVIDTSAIIDGRILDVIEANFLDGTLVIPHFVLSELQRIADADDPLRRKRGRRGLEILDNLIKQRHLATEVVHDDFAEIKEVDAKLIKLCQQHHCDLITTDYNLNRVASLQNVRVLNVNQLANAVKATFLPGERLSLYIVKEGREPGQGLAYLEDGTMIVVEDAAHLIGSTVETVVTSNLQTNMGRMIFARLHDEAPASHQNA
jgi:uncharacterized protein YacL